MATLFTASHMKVKAVAALTQTGSTALWMSRLNCGVPIYALTPEPDAYRRMDRNTMEPQLRDWLGKEEAGRVRAAIAGSLVERLHEDRQPASAETIAIAAARLATESDPRARSALIELLGTAAATDAAAKQALIKQFPRETVVDLKVLIGRFVSGDDLK